MASYLTNNFSLSMLAGMVPGQQYAITTRTITQDQASEYCETAKPSPAVNSDACGVIYSALLDAEVTRLQGRLKLYPGDYLLVGKYHGPKLVDGMTELPKGGKVIWTLVDIA